MTLFCHRCGEEIAPAGAATPSFCPHCGAPQLELAEDQRLTLHAEAAATTGELPPPRPGTIVWRPVLQAALVVAGIAALLWLASLPLPAIGVVCWLWILSGSLVVLESYRRRQPAARIDAAVGARVGLAFGFTLDATLALAVSGAGVAARFLTHSLAPMDAQIGQQITASLQAQSAHGPIPADLAHLFATPEFRAGLILGVLVFCALVLLMLSTLSGALAGMLAPRRPALR